MSGTGGRPCEQEERSLLSGVGIGGGGAVIEVCHRATSPPGLGSIGGTGPWPKRGVGSCRVVWAVMLRATRAQEEWPSWV
eukprot:scaffold5706_cov124-Isochrysis_galbana.AAC.3